MGRSPCCEKSHTNKGAWTKEEDQRLINYIRAHGEGCWRILPKAAGLLRCGKSCRLRWTNYLRPDLKRGNFTQQEDETIIKLHSLLGNKWSLIAGRLAGRTDNEIKNYWNTHIKRKLIARGIDPLTHRPLNSTTATALNTCLDLRNRSTSLVNHDPTTDNYSSSSSKCNSTTTDDSHRPPPPEEEEGNAAHALDLELSIGLPSQDANYYSKTNSFNSSLSAPQTIMSFHDDFLAAETPSPAVNCSCRQLGFQNGQSCSNCQSYI